MRHQKHYIIVLLISLMSLVSFQSFKNIEEDNLLEKIYTQTDRDIYFAGETIWFKSYIVNADNTPSIKNDFVNAVLISPEGRIIKKIKLSVKDGYAYGDFNTDYTWLEGVYTMKLYTNSMRNFGESSFFTKKITLKKTAIEYKLDLKLEFQKKEEYKNSSKITTAFEVRDENNNLLKNQKVKFEVTSRGEKIITDSIITDSEGKANPTFTIPKLITDVSDLTSYVSNSVSYKDLYVTVFIPNNGNTKAISRSVNVPIVLDTIDLQFFPESGKIIANSTNNIAFKAIDEFGKPVTIKGIIVDENDTAITTFNSFHDGMGSFKLQAKEGKKFYAKITAPFVSAKRIELPKIQIKGTQFSVITDSLQTKISLFSTEKEMLFLEVSNASKKLLTKNIKPTEKEVFVGTKNFPMGITKLSLRNTSKEIVAERLVFINAYKKLNVTMSIDKEIYKTREKVSVTIKTTDENNIPIPSNLSVAITNDKLTNTNQDNILSSLLLSSELKGKIHKPSFYFNAKEPKFILAIDYVMLTHGWRDYINTPSLTFENAKYKPEKEGFHSGRITDTKGNPIKANLILLDVKEEEALAFETNETGKFNFKTRASKAYTLLAYREDAEKLEIHKDTILLENYYTKNYNKRTEVKYLQGTLVGFKVDEKPKEYKYSGDYTAGAEVGIMPCGGYGINSYSEPLIVIDGVIVEDGLSNIDLNTVVSLEVLKDASATAIYGSRGANGVVLVTTKSYSILNSLFKKEKRYVSKSFRTKNHTKPYSSKFFYVPKYNSKEIVDTPTDFRQTLYWNPIVQTDENGEAKFEFYNSDIISSFKIVTEGIGFNGLVGRDEKMYTTKKM